jgi:haloalkane dehalogenase
MPEPSWLDREEYPFTSRFLEVPAGRLHYVDEGEGEPIVMVHGNPSWSFMYRKEIQDLRKNFRCIALDHLGFGLSEKPWDFDYKPASHSANLGRLLDHLKLDSFTLQVHDWGGPIGLGQAVENPERVQRLVILNTWMWPMDHVPQARRFSSMMGGPLGRFWTRYGDAFVRVMMPMTFPDKSKFRAVKKYYTSVCNSSKERKGMWTFPKEIIASSDWLGSLWDRREAIADKPALLVWALKDPVFRKEALERWQGLLRNHQVEKLPGVGHYVAEELGHELSPLVERFLKS